MNKTQISIIQEEGNTFNISLKGNIEDILKGLAGAPEHMQEMLRAIYLGYLNQATIEYYKGESL